MLHLYGMPLSSPTNKIRYLANYLHIPYEFHVINLNAGEHRSSEFLKINPYGKVPAIKDSNFTLAESNAIIRYLADKHHSPIYPRELQQRAVVDQWIDYASHHIMMALSKIMFNTYFYKFLGVERDERSLQDGHKFINQYLPIIEQQLTQHPFIASSTLTLADLSMLAALDTCETSQVDLSPYSHIVAWRKKLMSEPFYRNCHESFAIAFNKAMSDTSAKV